MRRMWRWNISCDTQNKLNAYILAVKAWASLHNSQINQRLHYSLLDFTLYRLSFSYQNTPIKLFSEAFITCKWITAFCTWCGHIFHI